MADGMTLYSRSRIAARALPSAARRLLLAVTLASAAGCDAITSPSQYGTISVAVRTRSGEPVADVPVELYTGVRPMGYARTDANGRYTFERVPVGVYGVVILAPSGYATKEAVIRTPRPSTLSDGLTLLADSLVTVEFELLKRGEGSLSVTVRDSGGTPVAGVAATLYAPNGVLANAITNAAGRATFTSLPLGKYGVWIVRPPGFIDVGEALRIFRDDLVVDGGSAQDVAFTLAPCAGGIGVAVRDEAGRGVSGAPIRLYSAISVIRDAVTGVDGTFRFTPVTCGEYGVTIMPRAGYTVAAGRGNSFVDGVLLRRGGSPSVSLAVRSCAATLNVSVRDASGVAVAGATLSLYNARGPLASLVTGSSGTVSFPAVLCGEDVGVNVTPPAGYSVPPGNGSSFFDGIRLTNGAVGSQVFVLNRP